MDKKTLRGIMPAGLGAVQRRLVEDLADGGWAPVAAGRRLGRQEASSLRQAARTLAAHGIVELRRSEDGLEARLLLREAEPTPEQREAASKRRKRRAEQADRDERILALHDLGLSQREIAGLLGVSQPAVSQRLSGAMVRTGRMAEEAAKREHAIRAENAAADAETAERLVGEAAARLEAAALCASELARLDPGRAVELRAAVAGDVGDIEAWIAKIWIVLDLFDQ